MPLYLVTGGAGFIGSHIVEMLVQRGAAVRVLDNFSTGRRINLEHLAGLDLVEGDVRNVQTVRRAVNGADYVIHLAALVSVPESMIDPITAHHVNVDGTLNILMAAREFGVKRVVLSSSCAVYGDNDELPLREASAIKPMSPYAASKMIGELYCQTFYRAYAVPTVCLRYFNIYGPRQNPNSDYSAVIPKFAQRIYDGRPPVIFGDGLQTRDFVHVSDVVRANLLACEHVEAIGCVFNVASGRALSLLDLVEAFNQLTGHHYQPQFEPAREGDIRHSRGDGGYIASVLGFKPQLSLEEGLRHLWLTQFRPMA